MMTLNKDEKESFYRAQNKTKRIRNFYLHLILYFIGIALIAYNFYIMSGPYTSIITGVNITTIVLWSIVIIVHGWSVFKGQLFFKKSWEDRKVEQFLKEEKEEETTMWE
tara:strand:- start:21853 stop:22179 length:327 start_codon:yes stop_codon:yes gene_type:complete